MRLIAFRLALCVTLLLTIGLWVESDTRAQSDGVPYCPDTLPTRLLPGLPGRVLPGSANNVRSAASRSGELVGRLEGGTLFEVLSGPACGDGFTWWLVRAGAVRGWTVEAVGEDYALEPVLPAPPLVVQERQQFGTGTLSYAGVSLEIDPAFYQGASARVVPQSESVGEPFRNPDHIFIAVDSNAPDLAGWLLVLPAAGFDNLHLNSLDTLRAALAEAPERQTTLAPVFYESGFIGSLVVNEQERFLEFQNGAGYRSLVYMSAEGTLFLPDLYYIFVGLTNDGRHLVRARLPVRYTLPLSPTPDWNAEGLDQLDSYREDFRQRIAEAGVSALRPALAQYDALIASLMIDPDTLAESVAVYEEQAAFLAPTAQFIQATSSAATLQAHPGLHLTYEIILAERQATLNAAATQGITVTATPELNITPTPTVQCGAFASRLIVDALALQALAQDSLRVRETPGGAATGQNIFPGEQVRVLAGPTCLDGVAWWQVAALDGAWEGWVAEHGTERYFYDPITLTPTPTVTFTPSMTFTPSVTPTFPPAPTRIVTTCRITAINDARLRSLPDVSVEPTYYLGAGRSVYVDGQFQRRGEDFPWWRIVERSQVFGLAGGAPVVGINLWVRADFVTEEGDCDSQPVIANP